MPNRVIWVPSWGRRCGVARYAQEFLRRVRPRRELPTPIAGPPSDPGIGLLHVEHQDLLFGDDDLTTQLDLIRAAGGRVLLTEHSVGPGRRAYEERADIVVALTDGGVQRLRERLPAERVRRIHHGCQTWFPPRKSKRGTVLGAMGFLKDHKGFTRLLDVLRALPGTELLLFATPESGDRAADWARACRGLPVRWYPGFLPERTVARRLAAEADVAVFWYDERTTISASGAVRIALASGVPVLASPTSWFGDLAEATYQPADLVDGVARLLADTPLRDRVTDAARDYCCRHSWRRTAQAYLELWREIPGEI